MAKETAKTDKAAVYEVAFHIVPTVSPETLPKEFDAIKAVLGGVGATIISEEAPKMRPLAYTMTKVIGPNRHRFDTAYFGWIKFEAAPEAIAEVNKAMDASDKVIRHLVVKTVRENTLHGERIMAAERAAAEAKANAEKSSEKAQDTDKAIDKLVA
ncbi:MAG TPA: 30S ribosomal protein S6 [Candidatus Paceibacterota bacterium]|jgi:Ribosomal protein S6